MSKKPATQQRVIEPLNDAPLGVERDVMAPWGTMERARIISSREVDGSRSKYAFVYRPKGNYCVRASVFRLNGETV